MMNDVERRAETPILVPERVQGVRVGRQHPAERARPERCDVRLGKRSEKTFLSASAHVVAAVLLSVVENSEVDARCVKERGQPAADFQGAWVVGGVVSRKPQHIHWAF